MKNKIDVENPEDEELSRGLKDIYNIIKNFIINDIGKNFFVPLSIKINKKFD